MLLVVEDAPWIPPGRPWRLSEIDLFVDLTEAEMDLISASAPMAEFPRGAILHDPNSDAEVLYILKAGRVRTYHVGPDGRRLTTAIHQPGDLLGSMSILGQRLDASWVECLDPATVCTMRRPDVERLLLSDPRVAARITEKLAARVAELEQRLSDTVLRSVPARTAAALIALSGPDGSSTIRLTHEQLADLVGTGRETTTRVLGEFADRGYIVLRRGRIAMRDLAGLRELASDEDAIRSIRTR